jgi:hypothetical protein
MEDPGHTALSVTRKLVAQHLSKEDLDRLVKSAGPLPRDSDYNALRSGIVDAVAWCLFAHMLTPFRRLADNRRALLNSSRHAEIAATALAAVRSSLAELFPWSRDLLLQHWKLARKLAKVRKLEPDSGGDSDLDAFLTAAGDEMRTLASIAARHADMLCLADRGGRTPRIVAFQMLIEDLARGYRSATGRRPTVTNDPIGIRHGGPFVRLVEAVLPTVESLVSEVSGRPLRYPTTDYARGQEIRRVLTKAQNSTKQRSKL